MHQIPFKVAPLYLNLFYLEELCYISPQKEIVHVCVQDKSNHLKIDTKYTY